MAKLHDLVVEEEAGFIKPIYLEEGWWWSFKDHVRKSYLYKNSQFEIKNDDRDKRPFKNIVRPILNIHYRIEGFDVKDIELYVNNPDTFYKSFLIRKFHEKWALENQMDTFIDDIVESFVDYGGVLVKNVNDTRPEVVDLKTIAFCDQTDLLSGPFAIKHFFNPDQLREMQAVGWGDESKGATISIEDLIIKAENNKQQDKETVKSETPGKYIEVYEVHGTFPSNYLRKEDDQEDGKYVSQIQILAFYKTEDGNKVGVTLFANEEPNLPFKFLARDKVQGRALGFGAVEELFEAQIWTNFSEIQMMGMLEFASKTLFKTNDKQFKSRNNLSNAENGQIFDLLEGKDINQLDTAPRNLDAFNGAVKEWEEHASIMGAASDLFLGQQPSAGTPFKSVETQLIEGKSLHLWRQGKIAVFVDEIYREWILPRMAKEITKGQKFLVELSADELQEVVSKVVDKKAFESVKEQILNGELPSQEEVELEKVKIREQFLAGGSKRFIEILKKEFKGEDLDVFTNIAGKQKKLHELTDKVVNVLRQFISTPEIRQDPEMVKLLNTILESSGMSPIIFGAKPPLVPTQGGGGTEALKDLAQSGREVAKV